MAQQDNLISEAYLKTKTDVLSQYMSSFTPSNSTGTLQTFNPIELMSLESQSGISNLQIFEQASSTYIVLTTLTPSMSLRNTTLTVVEDGAGQVLLL
jgi:hypothetical protein